MKGRSPVWILRWQAKLDDCKKSMTGLQSRAESVHQQMLYDSLYGHIYEAFPQYEFASELLMHCVG